MTKAQALRKLATLGWTPVDPPVNHPRPGRSYAYLRNADNNEVGYFCPRDLLAELTRSSLPSAAEIVGEAPGGDDQPGTVKIASQDIGQLWEPHVRFDDHPDKRKL